MALGNFKTALFNAVAGDIEIVAAVAGKKIAVHGYIITADTVNGSVRFEDGAGGAPLSGVMNIQEDGNIILPFSPVAWFTTSVNTALSIEATTTGAGGHLIYREID